MNLWAIRHAPVRAKGLCYGRTDVETILDAEEVAERLSPLLDEHPPRILWSSNAARCREPAVALGQRLGWPVRCTDQVAEIHYGEWDGRLWEEIEAADGARMHEWMNHWETQAPPGGETLAALEARVREFVSGLDQDALLFAHAGVVRALHVILGGQSWPDAMDQGVEHLELTTFELPLPR